MEEIRSYLNLENVLPIKAKAKKKVMKWALAIGLIFDIIISILILCYSYNIYKKIILIVIIQFPIIAGCCTFSHLFYLFIVDEERTKLKGKLAQVCLSESKWTKVLPVRADKYQDFIFNELPARAEFFAKLQEDSDIIDVSIKFNNEEKYLNFEKINKNSFLNYYLVLENN